MRRNPTKVGNPGDSRGRYSSNIQFFPPPGGAHLELYLPLGDPLFTLWGGSKRKPSPQIEILAGTAPLLPQLVVNSVSYVSNPEYRDSLSAREYADIGGQVQRFVSFRRVC